MHLDVGGHPLHTRAVAVTLRQRADGRLDVHAVLLDVRKRGFVPVGGDLQGPGILHHMLLDGVADPATGRLDAIQASQPTVAFDASPLTGGESCRDPIDRIAALAGSHLDDGFTRAVGAAVGGPRGCSHIMTLAHLLGATVAGVLARGLPASYRPGERAFRRDLVVDGHETAPGRLLLAAQLTDLSFAPAPPLARPMERFAGAHEVRVLAPVDLKSFTLGTVTGAERRRAPATLDDAPWESRHDTLAPLAGTGIGAGITAALFARLGGGPPDAPDRPLLDALLMVAPTVVQCMAALSDTWLLAARGSAARVDIGGLPDSCWMWRRDGALARSRESGGTPPPRRI